LYARTPLNISLDMVAPIPINGQGLTANSQSQHTHAQVAMLQYLLPLVQSQKTASANAIATALQWQQLKATIASAKVNQWPMAKAKGR
jgi:hypothetical protein